MVHIDDVRRLVHWTSTGMQRGDSLMDEEPECKIPFGRWAEEDRRTYVDLFREYMQLEDDIQALLLKQHRIGRKAGAIQQKYDRRKATA